MGKTLFEKIWEKHLVTTIEGGPSVLYIDKHLIHEVTSPQAFKGLSKRGLHVFRPQQVVATADHNVPTIDQHLPIREELSRKQVDALKENCAAFGIDHERRLALAHDASRLVGEDVFTTVHQGRLGPEGGPFVLRFHLHPSVQAEYAGDGHAIALTLPSGEIWRFTCEGHTARIEDSIYFAAPDGSRPSRMIVIDGRVADTDALRWSLVRREF